MPRYLKTTAIRRLESAVESLRLGLSGVLVPTRYKPRVPNAELSPSVGLIGVAAELGMSACLVQAHGEQFLRLPSGQYKPGGQVLDDFRALVKNATPSTDFITLGLNNPSDHREFIIESVKRFRVLIKMRAGALHAGRGVEREVCLSVGNDVITFLKTLSKSTKINPYLEDLPEIDFIQKDRILLVEDLVRRIDTATNLEEQAAVVSALYLVFPDIPDDEPDWLDALGRVSAVPRQRDISFLLDVLEHARPGTLRRASQLGGTIPVTIQPDHPGAIPIAPHFLRTQFNDIPDQWQADIANANGRLASGVFDPPPEWFVKQIFAIGLENIGVVSIGNKLTAHSAWPFVASSLAVPTRQTPGPYWFVVRQTQDLGQLLSKLREAANVASPYLGQRLDEVNTGISAIQTGNPISGPSSIFVPLLEHFRSSEYKRERLHVYLRSSRGTPRALPQALDDELNSISESDEPIGDFLLKLLQEENASIPIGYWARTLCEAAVDLEDAPGLFAVLQSSSTEGAHTAARKSIRMLDFLNYGPPLE